MAKATRSTYYRNHHSPIEYTFDFSLLVKLLIKDKVFELKIGRGIKKIKFINLYIHRIDRIDFGGLLKEYLRQM